MEEEQKKNSLLYMICGVDITTGFSEEIAQLEDTVVISYIG